MKPNLFMNHPTQMDPNFIKSIYIHMNLILLNIRTWIVVYMQACLWEDRGGYKWYLSPKLLDTVGVFQFFLLHFPHLSTWLSYRLWYRLDLNWNLLKNFHNFICCSKINKKIPHTFSKDEGWQSSLSVFKSTVIAFSLSTGGTSQVTPFRFGSYLNWKLVMHPLAMQHQFFLSPMVYRF